VALFVTFAQFVGLGSGIALLRHLARDGELHGRLKATQRGYFWTGLLLFVIVWPASILLLSDVLPAATLALLAAAEIVIAPMVLPLVYRYQASERLFVSGSLLALAPFVRFCAVLAALLLGMHDVEDFAKLYFCGMAITITLALIATRSRLLSITQHHPLFTVLREGLPYMVSGTALTAGSELDKTILLRSAGGIAAGQYSAAFRIMQAATLPVNSLILAASSRMFRSPGRHAPGFAGTLLLSIFCYAVATSVILWLTAPFAHLLLGEQFRDTTGYLRGLSVVLITNCIRQFVTAQLTTGDFQTSRNFIEVIGLAISLTTLLILVPTLHAWGAVIALGISDLSVVALSWTRMHRANARADGKST
jgi:O-antigen/teichoic acid export membrane protein